MRSRILYVEGDEATRQIIADAFSEYEITTAHSIREAWSFIASRSYSLIIMDSELRDGTGVDLCRTIRAVDPATPILFYSDGFHHTSRGAAPARNNT